MKHGVSRAMCTTAKHIYINIYINMKHSVVMIIYVVLLYVPFVKWWGGQEVHKRGRGGGYIW